LGQKVHPVGSRLGFIKSWDAKWFGGKNLPQMLHEDIIIREFIKKKLHQSGVGKVKIERAGKSLRVDIHTARPGLVIGKRGADIENLRTDLEEMTDQKVFINIIPIKKPELDAQVVATGVAMQLEKKMPYRRVMKRAISRAMDGGAGGIKVCVSGRLGGAEIARTEWLKEGRIPLQTFRADIDYGFTESFTTYGQIGVKVWIFKEELTKKAQQEEVGEPANKEEEKKEKKEEKVEKENKEEKVEKSEKDEVNTDANAQES
jgi:small subunit ribosomal protein S3